MVMHLQQKIYTIIVIVAILFTQNVHSLLQKDLKNAQRKLLST